MRIDIGGGGGGGFVSYMVGSGGTPDGVGGRGRGLTFPTDTTPAYEGYPSEVKLFWVLP